MKELLNNLDNKIKQIKEDYDFDRGLVIDRCSGIHDAKEIIKSTLLIDEIMQQIYISMKNLGATSDLLGIIGSYGDVMSNSDTLDALKSFNTLNP